MAETTYTVQATRFGYLRNRDLVEKAAEEGRVIPPIVDYLEAGRQVKLDPDHPLTQKALASGSIEEPGAAAEKRKAELQAELDRLDAEKAALEAQATPPDELKGKQLDDALGAAGLSKDGSADEKRERLAAVQPPA